MRYYFPYSCSSRLGQHSMMSAALLHMLNSSPCYCSSLAAPNKLDDSTQFLIYWVHAMSLRLKMHKSLCFTAQKSCEGLAIQNLEAGLQVTNLHMWHWCIATLRKCRHPACILMGLQAESLQIYGFGTVQSDVQNQRFCCRLQDHCIVMYLPLGKRRHTLCQGLSAMQLVMHLQSGLCVLVKSRSLHRVFLTYCSTIILMSRLSMLHCCAQ